MKFDFCVIGAGIVGIATAHELQKANPGAGILLLEKEQQPALHQTGRNSGVIHAGIYYKPKSLKAELCRAGLRATKDFCDENGIAYETRGKLIVATTDLELSRMKDLKVNAEANGIAIEDLDSQELTRREPNIVGKGALFVAETGIVDYKAVCRAMLAQLEAGGAEIAFGHEVTAIREDAHHVTVEAGGKTFTCGKLVCCAGLQSDRIARLAGLEPGYQIVPFRGEYHRLADRCNDIIQHLIYPVPDPNLPFLGIHLTPMIGGYVTVGPNAVLGMAREGYDRFSFRAGDVAGYATFPGFWKTAAQNWRSGLSEFRNSIFTRHYLAQCQKYCPSLTVEDLKPHAAGIRAQAVLTNGALAHDFLFLQSPRMLHVGNAPSPAATSAIPIARMILSRAGVARQQA